jgi:hypothetical protein
VTRDERGGDLVGGVRGEESWAGEGLEGKVNQRRSEAGEAEIQRREQRGGVEDE